MSFQFKQPPKRELLGGDLLAQSLKHLGADLAFGIHGGHLDAFLVGAATAGIELVDTRHETVAVQAAEGYAKLSGKVGVCFVTANSGFCNSLPGICTAFADRSPVFVVTSSPPLRDAETNCLQGFHDQVVLGKPVSKFAHRVTNAEEIPRIVSYAYRTASNGIPGPVIVDFPIDVLFSPPRMEAISYGSLTSAPALPPAPNPASVGQLMSAWREAQRPAIICGTGAARASDPLPGDSDKSHTLLLQLAEATSTPIFYSSKFSPRIPWDHPLRAGPAVNLAALPSLNEKPTDLIVLIGARTGFLLGGRSGAIIPNKGCKLVQIDVDGAEIGKSHSVDLSIVSDASVFIKTFLSALSDSPFERKDFGRDPWIQTTLRLKNLVHEKYSKDEKMQESKDGLNKLHPYHVINTLFETVAQVEPIIIIDGGEAGCWVLDLMETARPTHSLVSTGYLGFLGNGFGYSLGASYAHPDRLILNCQGDGSVGFHIQELDTYARHGRRILTVVMNNDYWGMSIAGQDIIYGSDDPARPCAQLSPNCRYEIVAQGFDCEGLRVEKLDSMKADVTKLVNKMNDQKRAGLLNLIVSTEPVTDTTKGMVGKVAKEEEDKWIVVPYYDNVPRPYYKEGTGSGGGPGGNLNGSQFMNLTGDKNGAITLTATASDKSNNGTKDDPADGPLKLI